MWGKKNPKVCVRVPDNNDTQHTAHSTQRTTHSAACAWVSASTHCKSWPLTVTAAAASAAATPASHMGIEFTLTGFNNSKVQNPSKAFPPELFFMQWVGVAAAAAGVLWLRNRAAAAKRHPKSSSGGGGGGGGSSKQLLRGAAIRRFFHLTNEFVLLNHGSYGTVPKPVLEVQHRAMTDVERFPDDYCACRLPCSAAFVCCRSASSYLFFPFPSDCDDAALLPLTLTHARTRAHTQTAAMHWIATARAAPPPQRW